jgi:hypothetical protein
MVKIKNVLLVIRGIFVAIFLISLTIYLNIKNKRDGFI